MMNEMKTAKFAIGQVVRHRLFPFRGVIFDVDPEFNNTEEWYEAIPAGGAPAQGPAFYHLLAENAETEYIAYVSEQNLLEDESGEPVRHPQLQRDVRPHARTAATRRRTGCSTDAFDGNRKRRGRSPAFSLSAGDARSVCRPWPCPALP